MVLNNNEVLASETVENYLKCIYAIEKHQADGGVSTNAIAEQLQTKASSVTDMLKKLKQRDLVDYKKYHGANLTAKGRNKAIEIIRKHRLWEVFLVEKLNFKWDEVHDMAEQLEHVEGQELSDRLDAFLGYPRFDPHGDPIPDAEGKIRDDRKKQALSTLSQNHSGVVVGVLDSSAPFLKYLDHLELKLGTELLVLEVIDFDKSMKIQIGQAIHNVSNQFAKNLLIRKEVN